MLSKFIGLGNKVELYAMDRKGEESKAYYSSIHEIRTEDSFEIIMPTEKARLVTLMVDTQWELFIYAKSGVYQCYARVIERYKSNNMYVIAMELVSNLCKYQRRDYYRFSCALEMYSRELVESESEAIRNNIPYELVPGVPMHHCIMVDISGGGLRFVSSHKFEKDSLVYCRFRLSRGGKQKQYEMICQMLSVREVDNRKGTFEHRVQYYGIREDVREEIIKYIFEEERKSRRKDSYI